MRMFRFWSSLAVSALLIYSVSAFAQRGAGVGRSSSASGSTMGESSSARSGNEGRSTEMGNSSASHASVASQSPGTILSNSKTDTALTNALGKSGVTIPDGDLKTACSGFKDLGQCVAALHVAKNLNLNFSDLQSKMTGTNAVSLGKAIESLVDPNVNAKSEAKKANKQASQDLSSVESHS